MDFFAEVSSQMARNRVGVEAAGNGNELDIMGRVDVNLRINIYISRKKKRRTRRTRRPIMQACQLR